MLRQRILKATGCEVIRAEKASGLRRDGCSKLQAPIDFCLPVTRSL